MYDLTLTHMTSNLTKVFALDYGLSRVQNLQSYD
jgi:hypothetical protein